MSLDPAELLNALKRYSAHIAETLERNVAAARAQPPRGWHSAYLATCRINSARSTALARLEGASDYARECGAPDHEIDTAVMTAHNRILAATAEPEPDDDVTGGHL